MEQVNIVVLNYQTCEVDFYLGIPYSDEDSVDKFLKQKYGRTTDLEWMISDKPITIHNY